jgi:hypothetical protein
MAIETVEFNLSMTDPDSGEYLTANTYSLTVKDADGATETLLTNLSIGQLVMALCLERAVAKEKEIIDIMNSLNLTSSQLEALTTIETDAVAATDSSKLKLKEKTLTYDGDSYTYYAFLDEVIKLDSVPETVGPSDEEYNTLITALEQAMDQRNSINQQTMIELQSSTSKRDQAYDMISNILKSLGNVLTGTVNNM